MRISITKKLLIYFFVLSLAGVVSIGTYSYFKAREALIARTFDQLRSVRIEKENRIKEFFNASITDLNKLSSFRESYEIINNLSDTSSELSPQYTGLIKAFFHSSEIYENISYYADNKNCKTFHISESNFHEQNATSENLQAAYDQLWIKTQTEEVAVIDSFRNVNSGKVKILLAKRFVFDNREGMFILQIPIEVINHIMFDNNPINGLGYSGEAYLVGNDFLMRSTSRFDEKSILITEVKTAGVFSALKNITGTDIFQDYRHIKVLSAFSKVSLPYLKWAILAEIDENEAMVSVNLIRNSIIYLTLIVSLLTLGVVAILSVTITQPIKAIQKETEKISRGEFGMIINLKSNDELGDLIEAFNNMSFRLYEQALKLEQERKLRITSMIDGQEIERQRLSRELHDSLGQHILAIKMRLENAVGAKPEESHRIINDAIESFSDTAREIRSISNGLMPAVLSEFGLVTALKNLKRDIFSTFNIEVEVNSNINDKALDVRQETYIFRICQEAINNITKYAKASKVIINLDKGEDFLNLYVMDNGVGFNVNEESLSKGNGLSNMKERAHLLDGNIKIESSKEEGTLIKVIIPIKNNTDD